ncbi:MAG: hypothetical protein ACI4O3_05400 [Oscillospiraceae bacterium]
MKAGTYRYKLEMTVPLGTRNGYLDLTICDNIAEGFLTMFTNTLAIGAGTCRGNQLSFCGKMKTLLSTISYRASGTVTRSQVDLVFHTERGDYPATGRQAFLDQRRGTGV